MRIVTYVLIVLCITTITFADESKQVILKVGDKAPQFAAVADNNELWDSQNHIGKHILVVYFYPGAMTAGCTTEACSYRDDLQELKNLGVEVIGISGDSVKNQQLFKQVNHLNFTLLSDVNGEIAKKFGVPVRQGGSTTQVLNNKKITLNRGVTASRWTFVIDKSGTIIYKNTSVDPAKDSQQVIAVIKGIEKEK